MSEFVIVVDDEDRGAVPGKPWTATISACEGASGIGATVADALADLAADLAQDLPPGMGLSTGG